MEANDSHSLYDIIKDIVIPLFGSILTLSGILLAIKTLKDNLNIARANFEFQMTISHRDTWRHITDLKLFRIKDPLADPTIISEEESTHINFVLINVKNVFDSRKKGILSQNDSEIFLMKDIGEFFSLPLPSAVWKKMSYLYEDDFKEYMKNCQLLNAGKPIPPKGLQKIIQNMDLKFRSEVQRTRNYFINNMPIELIYIRGLYKKRKSSIMDTSKISKKSKSMPRMRTKMRTKKLIKV